jgi:CBS domain-containing protein
MTTCNDVMTSWPTCCVPEDVAAKAAQLMHSQNIGSIPVIDGIRTRKLIGTVTDRDLALRVVANGLDGNAVQVRAVMSDDIATCRASDDVQVALDIMAQHQLRRIPVLDDEQKIVGIIAQTDVITRVNQSTKPPHWSR